MRCRKGKHTEDDPDGNQYTGRDKGSFCGFLHLTTSCTRGDFPIKSDLMPFIIIAERADKSRCGIFGGKEKQNGEPDKNQSCPDKTHHGNVVF